MEVKEGVNKTIDKATDWFFDLKPMSKVGVITFILSLLFLACNYFSIPEKYKIKTKTESLSYLLMLTDKCNGDSLILNYVDEQKKAVLNEKTLTQNLLSALKGKINDTVSSDYQKNDKTTINFTTFSLTAGGGFYLLSVFGFIALLFLNKGKWYTNFSQALGTGVIIFYLGVILQIILTILIPIWIIKGFVVNYLINLFIQTLLFIIAYNYTKEKKKKASKE
jgi:hypothetical protein